MVLGFYHSHPDHPARPSEYDRINAWPFYSYLIVSILHAAPDAMTSWQLDVATEQFAEEQSICWTCSACESSTLAISLV